MDKELALAIEFNKAPIELQTLAKAHYDNVKALAKARNKFTEAGELVETVQRNYFETEKALRIALKNWTPEV